MTTKGGRRPTGRQPTRQQGQRGLRVPVVELRRRTASRQPWQASVSMAGMEVGATRLDEEVHVTIELMLESVPDGVVASGHLEAGWIAPCHRCAEDLRGRLACEVREVFETHPTEGESYPLASEELDLEPMVRDAVLLELPLVARCPYPDDDPCPLSGYSPSTWAASEAEEPGRGTTTGPGDEGRPGDPRWSALDELRFDE